MDPRPTVAQLIDRFDLHPLPEEGGLFRQTWAGPPGEDGHPTGTAIIVLLAAEGGHFSAMHRLPTDEVWFFHLGDPIELLLLHADGSTSVERLGGHVLAGEALQVVVEAGTWMGARVAPGGEWSLFATTMAPGFLPRDYEAGDADALAAAYPGEAERIRALCR
jgi:predicted cupin superfamily sugar epimerase